MSERGAFEARSASVVRETTETRVDVDLQVDGPAACEARTGVGFLDHMIDLFAMHGGFGLRVSCQGDLHVDEHHSVEDVAIALGQAFYEALGNKAFIRRFGSALVPMDSALARVVTDLSGRFYLRFHAHFERERVGDLPVEMVEHFWHSFAQHARCNLHVDVWHGKNAHHQIEAIFKAAARALREAVHRDSSFDRVPSTKGSL